MPALYRDRYRNRSVVALQGVWEKRQKRSNVRDMEYIFIRPFLKMKLNKKVLEIKHFLESFSK